MALVYLVNSLHSSVCPYENNHKSMNVHKVNVHMGDNKALHTFL